MPERKLKICSIDWDEYQKYLRNRGRERARAQNWTLDDEINFIMGGQAILFFCNRNDLLPSDVVFGYMGNKSALDLDEFYENNKKRRRN